MYLVRMLRSCLGTEDGACVREYQRHQIYLLPMLLTHRFTREGAARRLF